MYAHWQLMAVIITMQVGHAHFSVVKFNAPCGQLLIRRLLLRGVGTDATGERMKTSLDKLIPISQRRKA